MSAIADNVDRVRERIAKACGKVGRKQEEILLMAVTKTVPPVRIREAVAAGIALFGENRVQEAEAKIDAVGCNVVWHMVGHLQRNKVKKAVHMFDMIQSVDSYSLAQEIDKRCGQAGKAMDVLVEVNTSGEETKYGIKPQDAIDLIRKMSHLSNIAVRGLMTIGAFTEDERLVRNCFASLRRLAEAIRGAGLDDVEMRVLSMGMTSDFELAIEEGSNMVRVGTAIFGHR